MDAMLPAGRLYHVGYVVQDLEAAMKEFGGLMTSEWALVARRVSATWDPKSGRRDVPIGVTYSRTGPPHVELVEGVAGSLWEPSERPRLHHVGVWAGDMIAESAALTTQGYPVVGHGLDADGQTARFVYHDVGHGPLLELVDAAARDAWEAWVRGEQLQLGRLG
jgi:lactoylglutathione lyase